VSAPDRVKTGRAVPSRDAREEIASGPGAGGSEGCRRCHFLEDTELRKPNYSQDRAQRERDKAAKAKAKEQKRLDQKAAAAGVVENDPEGEAQPAEDEGR